MKVSQQSEEEYAQGLPTLSSSNMYGCVADLCRIGPRFAGTKGEAAAKDYVYERFVKSGLQDVHIEKFQYLCYMPVSSELSIASPFEASIRCEPLEYTANTQIEGKVVYAGTGTAMEIEELRRMGVDFADKVVLVRSMTPFWISPILEELGATGLVVVTDPPEDLIRCLTDRFYPPPLKPPYESHIAKIPGVIISIASAERLWSLLSLGKVRLRVRHQAEYSVKTGYNVLGSVQGCEWPEKKVMFSAHYDTQTVGGACDDATGVSGVVELARVMSRLHPRRTMIFSAFACEEIGLWGSSAYVEAHKDDVRKNYVAMVNLDSVSSSLCPNNTLWGTPARYTDYALKIADELGWKVTNVEDLAPLTWVDTAAFVDQGVPSMQAFEYLPIDPYYHTEKDILEHINSKKLARTVTVSGVCAFGAAYLPKVPF